MSQLSNEATTTMNISEIMSSNPRTVSPDTSVSEAARVMKEEDVGLVPVVERVGGAETRGRLVGVVTDRDIAIRHVAEGRSADSPVSDIMSGGVLTCGPNDSVDTAMELMGREQVRRIPIVDERGALVGVLAQADLARMPGNDRKVEKTVERISQPGGSHQN
ncbi:MAG: CBS domain-containing protein [Gemmatimonadaceae bacterium]